MSTLSTLKTLTLALAIAINRTQATVVVPYVSYIGPGPLGVPNEFVRNPVNESGGMFQGRFGIHLAIGAPPQHVWVAPHFYDSETYVKSASLCENSTQIEICESGYSGIFAANESSTFEGSNGSSFGRDTVSGFDAVPDLKNDEFKFGIQTTDEPNFVGQDWGTLGLGPNSTFLQTFFPGKEQVGIYYTGGNSTHGKPAHSIPPRPLVIYELEFDGYNQSHFMGDKFTQPIGPPSPLSNSSNPFTLNVTSIVVGRKEILGGDSYIATVDLSGRTSNIFPSSVYKSFVDATGAAIINGMPAYDIHNLPSTSIPDELYNLTISFINGNRGFTVTIPQEFYISYIQGLDPDHAVANILNADDPLVKQSWPDKGPVIALNQLMFTSYIGIDHAAGEWWLARAVHPWDEPANNNTAEPKENAAAGGIGDNLRKAMGAAAAFATAVVLLC
ncbi:uncharacterized protein DFL_001160 [Arthrobotrys flagrans]|uniref:Peptidase A1 domain-containing protein n=1 Tax=Arthrobotrys flagrans TaxID=97331 RepID=A0A437AGC2_ARTFL|nr:hypothetical protein DFL_001160 [Arthrobotrys flagrans]